MVMAQPAPKCVGREFVRQYYTVLNMAPLCLYRFYSTESSFTRGDDSNPREALLGQTQIYKYVKHLELADCRAKILLIDTQPTLSDGIVIQVTGELSTNGGAMRRFMQTFVLMPQAENKYYVHNDIFRYQDQVFEDDVDSNEPEDLADENVEEAIVPEEQQFEEEHFSPEPQHHQQNEPDLIPQQDFYQHAHHSQMNGNSGMDHEHHIASPPASEPSETAIHIEHEEVEVAAENEAPATVEEAYAAEEEVEVHSPEPAVEEMQPQSPPKQQTKIAPQPSAPAAPRSYAAFFKSSAPTQQYQTPDVIKSPEAPPQHQQQRPPRRSLPPSTNGYNTRLPPSNQDQAQEENPQSDWRSALDERRRMPRELSDSCQVFVGNMPHHLEEHSLRELFQKYGKIADVRINLGKSKVGGGPKGSWTPNFGFVTFAEEGAVGKCLADLPITTGCDHRLNVEEKKMRRMPDQYQRGGMRPPMGGRGSYNRMEGQGRAPRGGYNSGPPRR